MLPARSRTRDNAVSPFLGPKERGGKLEGVGWSEAGLCHDIAYRTVPCACCQTESDTSSSLRNSPV